MLCYVTDSYVQYQEAVKLHLEWIISPDDQLIERTATMYHMALTGMSSVLADSLITFDMPTLIMASGILWQVCDFYL